MKCERLKGKDMDRESAEMKGGWGGLRREEKSATVEMKKDRRNSRRKKRRVLQVIMK